MAGGRKLEFDKQQALDAATRVFWQKGYLGASLADLTLGMGINKPSMYSAFGNKEALFLQSTRHYVEQYASQHGHHLKDPSRTLRERIRNYLGSVVDAQFDEASPRGCFISLCLAEAASDCMPDQARKLIEEVAGYAQHELAALFQQDDEARQKGLDKTAGQNALTLVTLLHGAASMARAKRSRQELDPVLENTLDGIGL